MRKIIIANWKMHGELITVEKFIEKLDGTMSQEANVVLCLPFPYLYIASGKSFSIGGQDCSSQEKGAYTGDISATMLEDVGCKYVIVGHSERRSYHNETNSLVKEKAQTALKNNLIPVICVGEKVQDEGVANLFAQCDESLCDGSIIAYEPIWAIGTGISPTTHEIEKVSKQLHDRYKLPVLYGGSVNQKNASDIMNISSVSGLLVGKSSLDFNVFSQIVSDCKVLDINS